MRTSLNTIWDVKPQAKQPIVKFFVNRLFSFAMIGCLGFLLLVSFVIHSGLSAFTNYLNNYLPEMSLFIFKLIEIVISYLITTVLLAMVYKFMSDAKLKWNSVWLGALFTSFLFSIGKYLIGLYISTSNIGDTYGAAGSVVVVLAWVFYSSQIVFFGAEFTRALAIERGVPLDPKAIKPNLQVGIVNKTVLEKKE
jgi:membrane protein